MASSHLIFFGTYTNKGTSQGIYAARLDGETGALSALVLAATAPDPAWITLTPDRRFLYAIHPSAAQATGFSVDAARGTLTPLPAAVSPAAQPPSHLAVDATGRVLLAANYREGFVAAMPIAADGTLGATSVVRHTGQGTHPTRQEKPHAHSVTVSPDNRHVIVADLGVDRLFSYALDSATARLTPARVPYVAATPGAGPRHFKFGANGRHSYAINELNNTITAYDYVADSGALTARRTVSTLPPDYNAPSSTAEIRVHPNGRFLYGSNRGHDSIAVFHIDASTGALSPAPVELVPTGGKNPRNFALSPDGRWLVCGHQDTELVTVFRVDAETGRLTRTPHSATVPSAVCVLFFD
ncbi:MAG: lactonase family protein [Opitutaceae bacterium]|nr:lactonase family protein [Opitutaceae bacterium]